MRGLIEEGSEVINSQGSPAALDVALIAVLSAWSTMRSPPTARREPLPENWVTTRFVRFSMTRSRKRARQIRR